MAHSVHLLEKKLVCRSRSIVGMCPPRELNIAREYKMSTSLSAKATESLPLLRSAKADFGYLYVVKGRKWISEVG